MSKRKPSPRDALLRWLAGALVLLAIGAWGNMMPLMLILILVGSIAGFIAGVIHHGSGT
jgi:hypothetical protein